MLLYVNKFPGDLLETMVLENYFMEANVYTFRL